MSKFVRGLLDGRRATRNEVVCRRPPGELRLFMPARTATRTKTRASTGREKRRVCTENGRGGQSAFHPLAEPAQRECPGAARSSYRRGDRCDASLGTGCDRAVICSMIQRSMSESMLVIRSSPQGYSRKQTDMPAEWNSRRLLADLAFGIAACCRGRWP